MYEREMEARTSEVTLDRSKRPSLKIAPWVALTTANKVRRAKSSREGRGGKTTADARKER